jgi:hypothetical protein
MANGEAMTFLGEMEQIIISVQGVVVLWCTLKIFIIIIMKNN